jgi:hypothetical protein
MNLRSFSLKPFPGEDNAPDVKITGTIGRRADTLSIGYALLGNLSELAIPSQGELPGRKDRLWEGTCLEFFLGVKDSEPYWEFNLSPAGEPAFTSLPFRIQTEPEALRLSLDLEVGKIIPKDKTVEIAVSAVIETVTGKRSHWALVHPGPRPDFHRRDGFVLNLPGE